MLLLTCALGVQETSFQLKVQAPASVSAGSDFAATLRGSSSIDLLGYAARIIYDAAFFSMRNVDSFGGTVWEEADFFSAEDDPVVPGTIVVGVILDLDQKNGVTRIVPAGSELDFLHLGFRAAAVDVDTTTTIGFSDDIDSNVLVDVELSGHDIGNDLFLIPASIDIVAAPRPCRIENLVCERTPLGIGLSWRVAEDPSCRCESIEVRDVNTGAIIGVFPADATIAELPCSDLEGRGALGVVCIGPDGTEEAQARCDYVCAAFVRGDGNDDGTLDISDAVTVMMCLFRGVGCPSCLDAADCNDDGAIDTSDAVCALVCVFGPAGCPGPPFPACGDDETADPLDCAQYGSCEA